MEWLVLSWENHFIVVRIYVVGISWLLSLLICLPPILGWRPKRLPGECALSTDIGYVLYSALGSFYIPVILLIIVYARIFVVTKRHSRQRLKVLFFLSCLLDIVQLDALLLGLRGVVLQETERTGKTLCELAASAARNSLSNATVHGAPRSATITGYCWTFRYARTKIIC